jgi:hypothetical protein
VDLPEERCFRNSSSVSGGHHVPLLSWGDGVARKDLGKLLPWRENLQQLRQDRLTGMHLLHTFFIHRIQPLWRRRTKMWMYPGPSCPDRPSSKELSAVEVEARIHKVLHHGVNPTPGAVSYLISQVKSSTHRMYAHDQLFHTYGPKVFTDNQMSRIKYIYYINNVSKD